ncbi:MAG: adenylate/guanylate cyclase domain-containing protein [Verrucomicrobia bacterium]|nr:adenylate/guanylate cyclase domain-containing protein [Verrucomicrobiota bacterium]
MNYNGSLGRFLPRRFPSPKREARMTATISEIAWESPGSSAACEPSRWARRALSMPPSAASTGPLKEKPPRPAVPWKKCRNTRKMVEQLKSKERLREAFGQFLDPRIVANVVDAATGQLKEVAERRKVTIFFSDISNFSGIGEQLTAANLVRLLNRYFTASTEAIRAHHGIVDKFIGDAVMAFWASPFSTGETHARDGCLACLDLLKSFDGISQEISEITGLRRNVPKFHARMALATGDTVIGTVGSHTTKSFTVIGDTVNTASRLEGVNKIYGTNILLNEECFRLAEGDIEAREIDLVTVFGKVEPVRIFELQGRQGALDPVTAKLNNVYADGLQLYREQKWREAENAFRECLKIRQHDGPSLEFLTRIANFARTPPPKDWNGVWQTASK